MAGKYLISKSKNGKFHWSLKAGNGEIILASQMYEALASAKNGIDSCRENGVKDGQFERAEAKSGEFYFNLLAGNKQVIGKSEMYKTAASRDKGIDSVKRNAADAAVEDKSAEA